MAMTLMERKSIPKAKVQWRKGADNDEKNFDVFVPSPISNLYYARGQKRFGLCLELVTTPTPLPCGIRAQNVTFPKKAENRFLRLILEF